MEDPSGLHGEIIYFRGTSLGFAGASALQRLGITPVTTDPVVATTFATHGNTYGRGVLYIARTSDLGGATIIEGNVLAALECEFGVELTPSAFAQRCSIMVASTTARDCLRVLGVLCPPVIRDPEDVRMNLRLLPRLAPAEARRFVELVSASGGRHE